MWRSASQSYANPHALFTHIIQIPQEKFGSDWVEGKYIPGDVESGTIDGLTEGKSYEFRVRAVNKGGKGEPSEPTKPIIAKSRFGETDCGY